MDYSKDVEIVELIRTTLLSRGEGVEGDPARTIERYYDLDGNLVFEWDEWAQEGHRFHAWTV